MLASLRLRKHKFACMPLFFQGLATLFCIPTLCMKTLLKYNQVSQSSFRDPTMISSNTSIRTSLAVNGFVAPVDILDGETAAVYRGHLESFMQSYQDHPDYGQWTYFKSHLVLAWVAELARLPAVVDVAAATLGPDLLLCNSFIPVKPPRTKAYFGWHQDGRYWQIEPLEETVTLWLALSDVDLENGAMQALPGSHRSGFLEHEKTFDEDSMLRRGQQVQHDFDESQAVTIVLKPGQASLHDAYVLHGSGSNDSDDWRLAVGLTYCSAAVRTRSGQHDSALLVRGSRESINFHEEQPPDADLSPDALAEYARIRDLGSGRYADAVKK